MSVMIWSRHAWRVVLPIAAGALLSGVSAPVTFAQQSAAATAGTAAHAAAPGADRNGAVPAPQPKIVPAKEPSLIRGGANVIDHNAIGISVVRPDARKPTSPNLGRVAAPAPPVSPIPPVPPSRAASVGIAASPAPHIFTPAPRLPVLSHGAINGAAFTRPGTALAPLGGPAKHALAGINGTSIQPKH